MIKIERNFIDKSDFCFIILSLDIIQVYGYAISQNSNIKLKKLRNLFIN